MVTVRRVMMMTVLAASFGLAGLGDAPAQTKAKPKPKPAEPAVATLTFEVYKDTGGKYRWRCKDADDVNIGMASKGYENKADCLKTVEAIRSGAAKAKVDDQAK